MPPPYTFNGPSRITIGKGQIPMSYKESSVAA